MVTGYRLPDEMVTQRDEMVTQRVTGYRLPDEMVTQRDEMVTQRVTGYRLPDEMVTQRVTGYHFVPFVLVVGLRTV